VPNPWGHAYANVGSGFYYGRDGKPAPRDVLRRPLGNLTFAHMELAGIEAWWNAGEERRACCPASIGDAVTADVKLS